MKWIKFDKNNPPNAKDYVVCIRQKYPEFYWVGYWENRGKEDFTDECDIWMNLPRPECPTCGRSEVE